MILPPNKTAARLLFNKGGLPAGCSIQRKTVLFFRFLYITTLLQIVNPVNLKIYLQLFAFLLMLRKR